MNNLLTKKDIIALNLELGEKGEFSNEGSLDFALDLARTKKDILYQLAYIVRSLLVDYAFTDGNKRTASLVISYYFEHQGSPFSEESLLEAVKKIAKKNITAPAKITRLLYHVIKR